MEVVNIKIRVNKPYIYFYAEPNVVFVYKIPQQKYSNIEEFALNQESETFLINGEEDFEEFNHFNHSPLIGMGFSVNAEATIIMFDTLNKNV